MESENPQMGCKYSDIISIYQILFQSFTSIVRPYGTNEKAGWKLCATYLSSCPGVLRQLSRVLCWVAARSVSSCAKKSLRICAARQKSRQKWGFRFELSSEMLKSLLSSHLISQCACTESREYASGTLKTSDTVESKDCSAGFVPI